VQAFAWSTLQHRKTVVIVVGDCGTADRWQLADTDLAAAVNQFGDIL